MQISQQTRGRLISAARESIRQSQRGDHAMSWQSAKTWMDICPTDRVFVDAENGRKVGVVAFIGPDGVAHRSMLAAMRAWSEVRCAE